MAEREGFEPSDGQGPSTDFESAAFDHSATSPLLSVRRFSGSASSETFSTKIPKSDTFLIILTATEVNRKIILLLNLSG